MDDVLDANSYNQNKHSVDPGKVTSAQQHIVVELTDRIIGSCHVNKFRNTEPLMLTYVVRY